MEETGKKGRLFVVATPIGNLGDFSPRAVELLKQADFIAAEDTRVTMKLCHVFDIHSRLISCHRHNEGTKSEGLADLIADEGLTAALTTDAGTPCISDPGHELVAACIRRGVEVIPLPGCCAAIAAISVSGFDAREFAFYGFLPREKKALREKLKEIGQGVRVAAVHESPHRVKELTEMISEVLPDAMMTVCCDLTKLHEKTLYGKPEEILRTLSENVNTERGEYCVVLDLHRVPRDNTENGEFRDLSMEALLTEEMQKGLTLWEAQERLIQQGAKKNSVKQAAVHLKRMFQT